MSIILLILNIIAGIIFFVYLILIAVRINYLNEAILKDRVKEGLKRKGSIKRKRSTLPLNTKNSTKQVKKNKVSRKSQKQQKKSKNHIKESVSPTRLVKVIPYTEGNNDSPLSPDELLFKEDPRITSRSDEIKITFESPKDKRSNKKTFSITLHSIPTAKTQNDLPQVNPSSKNDEMSEVSKRLFSIDSPLDQEKRGSNLKSTLNSQNKEQEVGENESCEVSAHLKESTANLPNLSVIEVASPKRKTELALPKSQKSTSHLNKSVTY